jgi:hypothetical protein
MRLVRQRGVAELAREEITDRSGKAKYVVWGSDQGLMFRLAVDAGVRMVAAKIVDRCLRADTFS